MKKNLIKFAIIVVVILAYFIYVGMYYGKSRNLYDYDEIYKDKIDNMYTTIKVNSDNVVVEQKVKLNSYDLYHTYIPFPFEYNNEMAMVSVETVPKEVGEKSKLGIYKAGINYYHNTKFEKNNDNTITLTYKIPTELVAETTKDNSFIELKNINSQVLGTNEVKIILPHLNKNFLINGEKCNNEIDHNIYSISLKNYNKDLKLQFDKGYGKEVSNFERMIAKMDKVFKGKNQKENLNMLIIFAVVTLDLGGIVFVIRLNSGYGRKVKDYTRNPGCVMKPVFAEALIDGKVGAKELIMTCIVDLIHRGNLDIINDDEVKVLHLNKLKSIEIEILEMIFDESQKDLVGKSLKFSDMKKIFINDDKKTDRIFQSFLRIKKLIIEKLYEHKVFNKVLEEVNHLIRPICLLTIMNMVFIPILKFDAIGVFKIHIFIFNLIGFFFLYLFDYKKFILKTTPRSENRSGVLGSIVVLYSLAILTVIYLLKENPILIIGYSGLIIINIVTYQKSKRHVLTKIGKEELEKAQGLKKYIKDYSLMEQRDMDEAIVWDDYLTYATAFGIPNRITKKINDNLMEANAALLVINKILNI